jgi:hypothetical protein
MAPGCSMSNDHTQSQIIYHGSEVTDSGNQTGYSTKNSHNQIPLPDTPAPASPIIQSKSTKFIKKSPSFRTLDTVDSFEILEQTIMKQKRLGKTKNTDLRMKILLKRTFNLVCELMDDENTTDSTISTTQNTETISMEDNSNIQENNGDINLQETLIINLNESESLDSTFQSDEEELNYIDLENFNYENLIENNEQLVNSIRSEFENNNSENLDKNKSFLTEDFFSDINQYNSMPITWLTNSNNSNKKRRRSSADDDTDFEEFDESNGNENNYYLLSDLTNTNKKRCINNDNNDSYSTSSKKFKESINIVT